MGHGALLLYYRIVYSFEFVGDIVLKWVYLQSTLLKKFMSVKHVPQLINLSKFSEHADSIVYVLL